MKASGTVEQIGTKNVNTKYGQKPTFSVKVGGQWYKFGFKNPGVAAGDNVEFEYTPGTYGNEANPVSVKKSEAPAQPTAGDAAPVAMPTKSYRNGNFPIDPLDGQRSIIRQNALTNARELFVAAHGGKPFGVDEKSAERDAGIIIALAKRFEAYTAGDMDMELAKAALEADGETKQ